MAQAPNTFPFAIPSVENVIQTAPNAVGGQNLNVPIAAGAAMIPAVLHDAVDLVRCVRSAMDHGAGGLVDVLYAAKLRLVCITNALATNMFGGGNTQALLVQLAELTARVDAQEFNRRLRAANSRGQDLVVEALQKEISGSGFALATAIRPSTVTQQELVNMNAAAASPVGAVPPWHFNSNNYTHAAILRLVIFYNDDFGIVAGDLLEVRKEKLRSFFFS